MHATSILYIKFVREIRYHFINNKILLKYNTRVYNFEYKYFDIGLYNVYFYSHLLNFSRHFGLSGYTMES